MHSSNGNKHFLDIQFQNVPGKKLTPKDIEIAIKLVLEKHKPAMLGIAEPSYELLKCINFPGYTLERGRQKGSVKDKVRLNVLIKDTLTEYKIESLACDVPCLAIKTHQVRTVFFYREWRLLSRDKSERISLQELRWEGFLSKLSKLGGRTVIVGDANLCLVSNDTDHQKRLAPMKDMLYTFLAEKGYGQLIKEKTRFDKNQSGLLDHLYTNQHKFVSRIYNENIHGHDHSMVGVRLRTDKPVFHSDPIKIRHFDKVDPKMFDKVWFQSNPGELWETTDIDKMCEIFKFKLIHVFDILAPEKTYKQRESYAPFVDAELAKEIRMRNRLRKEAYLAADPELIIAAREFSKEVRRKLLVGEAEWSRNYLDFQNDKVGWKRLKKMSGLKSRGKSKLVLNVNGSLVDDPKVLSSQINDYFIKKVDLITAECPPSPEDAATYAAEYFSDKDVGTFSFHTVGFKFIRESIGKLNSVTSVGEDGIPVTVYKRFSGTLIPSLARIVNECIKQSYYPESWQRGLVSALHKKSEVTEVSNYRPVVLLPCVSRVLESCLTRQLRKYLEDRHLISSNQHAYRVKKSCSTALIDLETAVRHARDEKKAVGSLQTDMTAAFNCVHSSCLLPQLRLAGLTEPALKLLDSYMTGRMNAAKVGSCLSEFKAIKTGVGEGAQFAPTAWICYLIAAPAVLKRVKREIEAVTAAGSPLPQILVNNRDILRRPIRIKDINYADDINSLVIADTNQEVRRVMKLLEAEYSRYFKCLGLKESRAKQQHIFFTKAKDKNEDLSLNGRPAAKSIKMLGLTIDDSCDYSAHVTMTVGRVLGRVSHIKAVRKSVPRKILYQVGDALCLSIFKYCLELVGHNRAHLVRYQKTMNCLLRCLTFSDRDRSVEKMLAEAGMLNLQIQYSASLIWGFQRLINDEGSQLAWTYMDWARNRVRTQNTRTRHYTISWKPLTAEGHRSWLLRSSKEYNSFHLFQSSWETPKHEAKVTLKRILLNRYRNINLK